MNSTSLIVILRLPFCRLECFSIKGVDIWYPFFFWKWNSFSSKLKDALSHIILSSTPKSLSLCYIMEVPITLFLNIVHLTTLYLHSVSLDDFGCENSSSLTQAASTGVTPVASQAVIDQCLWRIREEEYRRGTRFSSSAYFSLIQDTDPTESMFLPFICRLRVFEIIVKLGHAMVDDFRILSLMGSLCISLTSPATL